MHAIARNRALVDGDKRLAWAATRAFCLLNGRDLVFTVDDAEQLVQSVARGELEAVEIERVLEAHLTSV
jgi:death-on-curing protein